MGDENGGRSYYVPEDLLKEIMYYLPVKSLIRFTCVCKSWLRLIKTDPEFAIKQYLTRATSTSSRILDNIEYMFNVENYMCTLNTKPCMYSFTEAKTLRPVSKFEFLPKRYIEVSNTCHGIICFRFSYKSAILLCNPSIQEVVLVPPTPNHGYTALGYDPISNDYKVLALHFPLSGRDDECCTLSVYSVRDGYWRNLEANASHRYDRIGDNNIGTNENGRLCNWLVYKQHEMSGKPVETVVSFDMAEEVLRELSVPDCSYLPKHEHQLVSSSRWQACLCCLPFYSTGYVNLWVVKRRSSDDDNCKEDWVWSKEISVIFPDQDLIRPLNFWISDMELLVIIAHEEKTREIFHYDIGTKQLKRTRRRGIGDLELPTYSCGYLGSLISIKQLMLLNQECKHGEEDNKPNDDQHLASRQEDNNGEYIFREVGRNGVRWSCRIKTMWPCD